MSNAEERAKFGVEVLREALTPSAKTKAAYMGEFQFNLPDYGEDGDEVMRSVKRQAVDFAIQHMSTQSPKEGE